MGYNRIMRSAAFRAVVLVTGTVLVTCAVTLSRPVLALLGAAVFIAYVILQVLSMKDMKERCHMLVEAIRNNDFSFRLPTNQFSYNEKVLQNTLNEFGQLMATQKLDMRQNESFYEQILSNVSSGIIVLGKDNRIVQSNAAAARLLALPVLGTLRQLQKYDPQLPDTLANLASGEHVQLNFQTRKGEAHLSVTAVSAMLDHEQMRILVLNDIRADIDQKEVESWQKLTRVLTHEIMNSIAPIVSISDTFMHRDDVKASPIYNGVQAIHDTSEGLMNFVESYRKFSSLQQPAPEPFELLPLINQVAEIMPMPANIKLTVSITPQETMLYADRGLIRQVLINLLKNAVQAIGDAKGGRILISSHIDAAEHVLVSVSNNGPAISPSEAEQVFVPFYTTKKSGSGIGLSLSRQIMKLSNGSITLLPAGTNGWNTTFMLEFD